MLYNTPKDKNEKTKLDFEALQKIANVVRRIAERIRATESRSPGSDQPRSNSPQADTDAPGPDSGTASDPNEKKPKRE
jgi:hypothetical protein